MNGADFEIVGYLQSLVEHSGCAREDCPTCLTLQAVCEIVRHRLFTSPVYPEVMISASSPANRDGGCASKLVERENHANPETCIGLA